MKHLPRLLIAFSVAALALIAEDFWVKKPYTEWSDKDANKMLTSSPWAHDVVITMGGGMEGRNGGAGGGRGGRGGGAGMNPGGNGMEAEGIGRSGAAPADSAAGAESGRGAAGLTLHVRWQSALPIRQALVVARLGREKLDSDQAKKFVETGMNYYVIAVVGFPQRMGISDDRLAELAKSTTLVRKDKDPITAETVQKLPGEAGLAFVFPKTSPIGVDDKEVEFVSKVGPLEVKRKFKLKEMMVGDKLEL
jgi:hypothetical protein